MGMNKDAKDPMTTKDNTTRMATGLVLVSLRTPDNGGSLPRRTTLQRSITGTGGVDIFVAISDCWKD